MSPLNINPISKILIIGGIILIMIGLFWQWSGKFLSLGHLPGDIRIEKDHFRFYFPVTTSLLMSALLSLIFYLFRRWR